MTDLENIVVAMLQRGIEGRDKGKVVAFREPGSMLHNMADVEVQWSKRRREWFSARELTGGLGWGSDA